MTITTRKPTGKPPWPITLIAGVEKAGKTYAAAQASASDMIGRTLWFTVGEDDPDEYGAIEGARFEIVQYDGTYRGLVNAMTDAAALKQDPARPDLWVLDSGSRLWALISDMAQAEANRRWSRRRDNQGKQVPDEGVTIGMDLWNVAKSRWQHVLDLLREHQGPSIITARLEKTSVVNDKGDPTGVKDWKVQAEKGLPFDVGVVVELHARGEAYLTGVRSLRFVAKEARTPYPGFTMVDLWTKLGLADETAGQRSHTSSNGEESLAADEVIIARRQELLAQLTEAAKAARTHTSAIAQDWISEHGHAINVTTDIGSLELLLDDLRARAKRMETAA
jgi:hypothetical protein